MTKDTFVYEGHELELFAHALNWKNYWSSQVKGYLGKRVLEVGAGIGANTPYLKSDAAEWVCLEPDEKLAAMIERRQDVRQRSAVVVKVGTIADLPTAPRFDSILYIDVLEHILDDRGEMQQAAMRLEFGGTLVALVPAHSWLYSAFDKSLGHYRRYSSDMVTSLTCPDLELIRLQHLDSVGLLASVANRFLLRQDIPTKAQILFWDRAMVPISRVLDRLFAYRFGKSILAVWQRSRNVQ